MKIGIIKYVLTLSTLLSAFASFSVEDSTGVPPSTLVLSDSIFNFMEDDESYFERYLWYLADTNGLLKIEEIASAEYQNKFLGVPLDSSGNVIDSLMTKSRVFWLRLQVINRSPHNGEWWFDSPAGNETKLFVPYHQEYLEKRTGFQLPLFDRDIKLGEDYLVSAFISADTTTTLFFRKDFLKESEISLINLANRNERIEDDRRDRYIQGAFFGLLVIIALYNLLLYFFVKETSNVFYAFYLFCITVSYLSTSGYGFELFWPEFPGNYIWIITVGWAMAGFFYVLFGRVYLHTSLYLPKWNKILNIHIIGSVIAIMVIVGTIIWLNYHGMISGNNVSVNGSSSFAGILAGIGVLLTVIWIFLGFFIVLIPAFFCWRKKFQPARYFLYASVSLAFGILVQIFGDSENIFTDNAFQFGMAFQAIFFSLGLGYRINLLQQEKQKAQEDALVELEQKVRERTFEVVRQKEIVEDKQKEIIDSITYAKRLQEAILPPLKIIKQYFPESFVLYIPKDIVAGDFYWFHSKSDFQSDSSTPDYKSDLLFIATADCTGHGVPGAMVSVVCSNALNRAVKEFNLRDTGKILDKVTDLVLETFEKSGEQIKDGMDISLLSYNKATKQIQWSGANNPLWYIQNPANYRAGGQIIEVRADKQPIGQFDTRKPFTTHNIELPTSDSPLQTTFYLFTDGLPDQFGGPKGKKFMYKRFETNLTGIHKLPMDEQQSILEKAFQDWKGNIEQVDDITVIGLRVGGMEEIPK